MPAAANDPGAASGVLAPPSCGVPSGTPRRSSLRFPLSLPGSFASLAMVTRTDSQARLALERRAGKTREPMRLDALAGTRLDDGWARRLGDAIGGARGCSHLLTLGHLLGSSAAWALARERALHGAAPARPAGQRVFRRDVVIDGHESAAAGLQLTAQTTDLHFAPAGAVVRPMERFAEQLEVRLVVEVEFPALTIG